MPSSPPQPGTVTIQRGLDGQDDNLDLLQSYFKELKAVTVEPSPPELDLLTFAICTHYFGVITLTEHKQDVDEDAEGELEEDSLDAASPPPSSSISRATSFTSARSAVHFEPKDSISNPGRAHIPPPSPEEEKVLKWREAFLAQLQEGDNEDFEPHLSKGKMRERQYIPRVNPPILIPSTSNDFDDYVNWPDDISSDEYAHDDQLYHKTEAYSRLDGAEFTPVLGQEILEPERFNSPVGISEIHPDPTLKAFMHEEASKYQGMLRAQRIKAYQDASAFKPLFIDPPSPQSAPIGIIYLASSQNVDDPMHRGQLNIGIYVAPKYIEEPGVVQAVKEVVNEAFHDSNCHRLQAIVVDHMTKIDTLELYTASGFSREGVGRRGFFSPITHEWKDVFYFAILATDWVFDNNNPRPRPKTLWEDLLFCHQREREELLRMEEKTLKRSTSTETIRNKTPIAPSIASTSRSETSSVASSSISANSSTRKENLKRKRVEVGSDLEKNTSRPRAPSTSTSSSIGTSDTMSTISSEWELPARQAFAIPTSNGTSPPPTSTSSTGNWVMLDLVNGN